MADNADARPTWTYYFGLPDRSGLARYAHLRRWVGDPTETKARGSEIVDGKRVAKRAAGWQKRVGTPEDCAARIDALLADGEPRTFNRIAVELVGSTADVLFESALDAGLWLLVERNRIAWACEEGAVFFLRSDFIELEPPAC